MLIDDKELNKNFTFLDFIPIMLLCLPEKEEPLLCLLDSGSSHTWINENQIPQHLEK